MEYYESWNVKEENKKWLPLIDNHQLEIYHYQCMLYEPPRNRPSSERDVLTVITYRKFVLMKYIYKFREGGRGLNRHQGKS